VKVHQTPPFTDTQFLKNPVLTEEWIQEIMINDANLSCRLGWSRVAKLWNERMCIYNGFGFRVPLPIWLCLSSWSCHKKAKLPVLPARAFTYRCKENLRLELVVCTLHRAEEQRIAHHHNPLVS
jgi:hypothetical protein